MGGSGFRSAKLEPLSPISLVAVSCFDSQSWTRRLAWS